MLPSSSSQERFLRKKKKKKEVVNIQERKQGSLITCVDFDKEVIPHEYHLLKIIFSFLKHFSLNFFFPFDCLHCCKQAFSSSGLWGLLSSCSAGGFSLWWLFLWCMGSRHVNFSNCSTLGSVVVAHGFSCSAATKDLGSSRIRDQIHVPCISRLDS